MNQTNQQKIDKQISRKNNQIFQNKLLLEQQNLLINVQNLLIKIQNLLIRIQNISMKIANMIVKQSQIKLRNKIVKQSQIKLKNKNYLIIIGIDLLGYILSFVSPINLKQVSRVSRLFLKTSKLYICNYLINNELLLHFVNGVCKDKNNIIRLFNNIKFWKNYHKITHINISSIVLRKIIRYFGYTEIIFWNKFARLTYLYFNNIENIELNSILDQLCQNSNIINSLQIFKYESKQIINVSIQSLKYLYTLKALISLQIKGNLLIENNLNNNTFIRNNLNNYKILLNILLIYPFKLKIMIIS